MRSTVDDVLARIPASTVERIELIRGGAGVDMAGHAVLANVVRRTDPEPEFAVEGGVAVSGDGQGWPVATLEYGRRRAGTTLDLGQVSVGVDYTGSFGSGGFANAATATLAGTF